MKEPGPSVISWRFTFYGQYVVSNVLPFGVGSICMFLFLFRRRKYPIFYYKVSRPPVRSHSRRGMTTMGPPVCWQNPLSLHVRILLYSQYLITLTDTIIYLMRVSAHHRGKPSFSLGNPALYRCAVQHGGVHRCFLLRGCPCRCPVLVASVHRFAELAHGSAIGCAFGGGQPGRDRLQLRHRQRFLLRLSDR
jgi:hypothetical protein